MEYLHLLYKLMTIFKYIMKFQRHLVKRLAFFRVGIVYQSFEIMIWWYYTNLSSKSYFSNENKSEYITLFIAAWISIYLICIIFDTFVLDLQNFNAWGKVQRSKNWLWKACPACFVLNCLWTGFIVQNPQNFSAKHRTFYSKCKTHIRTNISFHDCKEILDFTMIDINFE